jgi:putative transposase
MAQTHLSLHMHLIFHTKDNRQSIKPEWREDLHAFLGGCLKTAGCIPQAIGGTYDHVHILAGYRATHCIADVVKDIKVASSRWVHEQIGHPDFAWQGGYCAITVSPSQAPRVKGYIENQMEHHRIKTAREEYIELVDAAGIVYEEQYLWK